MSAFTELMRRRHTVRSYAPMPVEREKLRAVLEAGRWASTAVNAQPQRILVLDTPERLAKVRELLGIPASWLICSMLYLGYPAEGEEPAHLSGSRKLLGETCFFNEMPAGRC